MIKLGQTVKDKVTGFKGVAEARIEYMNGCIQILVRPTKVSKDGEFPTATYIDVEQLDVVKGTKILKLNKRNDIDEEPSGGIRQHPLRT